MKTVHFICRGGIFRSRVAQAIATSRADSSDDVRFVSSGIDAQENIYGNIAPWCSYELKKHQIEAYAQPSWIQTTQKLIDRSDELIFMSKDVFEDASKIYKLNKPKILWDVEDMYAEIDTQGFDKEKADIIYSQIVAKVSMLALRI
jgi:protein-tyrosine-phosphatase